MKGKKIMKEKKEIDEKEVITLKDSVLIYRSWHESMKEYLTPEQYVAAMDAVMSFYACGCQMPQTGDKMVDLMTSTFVHTLTTNAKKYIAGKRGGAPTKDGKKGADATA